MYPASIMWTPAMLLLKLKKSKESSIAKFMLTFLNSGDKLVYRNYSRGNLDTQIEYRCLL